MVLPFSKDTGIAILPRGTETDIFFDEPLPLDLSGVRGDPSLGKAEVSVLADGTLVRLPVPGGSFVRADHVSEGWEISIGARQVAIPIGLSVGSKSVEFSMTAPGRVLVAADAIDGGRILIGTNRSGRDGMSTSRRSVGFAAAETAVGLVIRPAAEDVMLRRTAGGFELSRGIGRSLDASPGFGSRTEEAGLSRSFHLATLGHSNLQDRLRNAMLRSATAPPSARLAPRLDVAETLIGLGLGREAQTALMAAAEDDPSFANDARATGLKALADLLSEDAVDPLDWKATNRRPTDELDLWQALATDPAAARATLDHALALISADGALIDRYPAAVARLARRRHAQLLLARGLPADLDELSRAPTMPESAVAQATAVALRGDPRRAVDLLGVLERSGDLGTAASAILARSVIDVKTGRSTPLAAVAVIKAHTLDWRATGMSDMAASVEANDLEQAGRFRDAIGLRAELGARTAAARDVNRAAIDADLQRMGDPAVTHTASAADLSDILSEQTAELARRPTVKRQIQTELVDRLDELGLPGKAADLLDDLIASGVTAPDRARMQDRLVELRLRADDVAAARRAFDLEGARETDPGAVARHALLEARLLARERHPDRALAAIADARGTQADELRAELLASCGRWHEAKALLQVLVQSLPPGRLLDGKQTDLVIRLATASARDGDRATLVAVAMQYDRRLADERSRTSLHLIAAAL